jgi:hypothetical protein
MRQHSQIRLTLPLALPLALLLAALPACDDPAGAAPTLLDEVRQETLRFQSTAEATAAGYQADHHCVAHPELGGMGFHWVNQGFVDPVFDPMQPEALLYAPAAGGGVELVGVEYIVIDVGQQRPSFDGHPLDVGGVPPLMEAGVAHWSLHVWAHRDNPSGLFAPFNPTVACD